MLVFVRSFSYTPHASFSAVKVEVGHKRLYSATVFLSLLMLVLVRCFSYILMLVLLRSFSYTPLASFSDEFLLQPCSF